MTLLGYPISHVTINGMVAISLGGIFHFVLVRDAEDYIRRYECEMLAEWWTIEGGAR